MRQIKKIQEAFNNGEWRCEYCHPDKWDGNDMDKCLDFLSKRHYGYKAIEDVVSEMFDEIITETAQRELHGFEDVAIEYIADRIAWDKLRDSKQKFPDSATFSLILH